MAGQNQRVFLAQFPNQLTNFDDLRRIQPHGGFVQNNDLRVSQQSLRNTHPLAVALGQVADQPFFYVGNAGLFHHRFDLPGAFLPPQALGLGHEAQVFLRRHFVVQRRKLRQVADVFLSLQGLLGHVVAIDEHLAIGSAQTAGHDVHGGGFSRAVRAQESVYDAPVNGKRQVVHRQMRSVTLGQMPYLDQFCFSPFAA